LTKKVVDIYIRVV